MLTTVADMHIHSCLSPCGSLTNSPRAIVEKAKALGLNLIAVTDHNTAKNIAPALEWGRRLGVTVIPGMEISSEEEVDVLAFFPTLDAALDMDQLITEYLPKRGYDPEKLGDQVYVNTEDEIEGSLDYYLAVAVQLSIDKIFSFIKERGGLFVPAHVNRPSFSLISQLGFIPDMDYDALEIIKPLENAPQGVSLLAHSDAHYLDDIGKRSTEYKKSINTFDALSQYLKSINEIKLNF